MPERLNFSLNEDHHPEKEIFFRAGLGLASLIAAFRAAALIFTDPDLRENILDNSFTCAPEQSRQGYRAHWQPPGEPLPQGTVLLS